MGTYFNSFTEAKKEAAQHPESEVLMHKLSSSGGYIPVWTTKDGDLFLVGLKESGTQQYLNYTTVKLSDPRWGPRLFGAKTLPFDEAKKLASSLADQTGNTYCVATASTGVIKFEGKSKKLKEGKDIPGERDGTGPHKDSAQKSIFDKGKRKKAGEKCPKEADDDEDSKDKKLKTESMLQGILSESSLLHEVKDPHKKLVMAIYKRMPIGNKDLRKGKHRIMFTGGMAKNSGYKEYERANLEDLSMEELKKIAAAINLKVEGYTIDREGPTSRKVVGMIEAKGGLSFGHPYDNAPPDEWAKKKGATHTIFLNRDIGGSGMRGAIIKKTTARVMVDEDAKGDPVWETWKLRKNIVFDKPGAIKRQSNGGWWY